MMVYDKVCWTCSGKGKIFETNPDRLRDCQICDGKGYVMTKKGMELIEFLKRWKIIETQTKS